MKNQLNYDKRNIRNTESDMKQIEKKTERNETDETNETNTNTTNNAHNLEQIMNNENDIWTPFLFKQFNWILNLDRSQIVFDILVVINVILLILEIGTYIFQGQIGNNAALKRSSNLSIAILGVWDFLFAILFISKNQFIQFYLWNKNYYEQVQKHATLCTLSAICLIFHSICEFVAGEINIPNQPITNRDNSGLTCLSIIFILPFLSMKEIREDYYDFFYFIHIALTIVFIVFAAIHSSTVIYIFIILFILWAVNFIFFIIRMSQNTCEIVDIKRTIGNVIRLDLRTSNKFKAGQFVFLWIPKISLFQFRPFFISSSPLEQGIITLIIKSTGTENWTDSLFELSKSWKSPYERQRIAELKRNRKKEEKQLGQSNDKNDKKNDKEDDNEEDENLYDGTFSIFLDGFYGNSIIPYSKYSPLIQQDELISQQEKYFEKYQYFLFISEGCNNTSLQSLFNDHVYVYDKIQDKNLKRKIYLNYIWTVSENVDITENYKYKATIEQIKYMHFTPNLINSQFILDCIPLDQKEHPPIRIKFFLDNLQKLKSQMYLNEKYDIDQGIQEEIEKITLLTNMKKTDDENNNNNNNNNTDEKNSNDEIKDINNIIEENTLIENFKKKKTYPETHYPIRLFTKPFNELTLSQQLDLMFEKAILDGVEKIVVVVNSLDESFIESCKNVCIEKSHLAVSIDFFQQSHYLQCQF